MSIFMVHAMHPGSSIMQLETPVAQDLLSPCLALDKRPTVLIVEDDHDVREAITVILECAGYESAGAADGAQAMQMLHAGLRPGLIVLDLMLPVLDGWQFRQEQRRHAEFESIPTIVCSALGDAERHAMRLGAVAGLTKPLDVDMLLALAERYCRREPLETG
ncbi:MAG TPA: response regulator [Candidatus Binatia bacterium]|nr:response regulator [Candidatus Binatia bacterium]